MNQHEDETFNIAIYTIKTSPPSFSHERLRSHVSSSIKHVWTLKTTARSHFCSLLFFFLFFFFFSFLPFFSLVSKMRSHENNLIITISRRRCVCSGVLFRFGTLILFFTTSFSLRLGFYFYFWAIIYQ